MDRIGQRSQKVLVYSFLPSDDVEEVINLRSRIRRRLEQNAFVFGSDESFFGDASERKTIEGLYDELSHPEEAAGKADDVDVVSLAYEIWRKAIEENPDLKTKVENLPDVVYATRHARGAPEGVVTYAKSALGFDAMAFTPGKASGGRPELLTPAEALERARCSPQDEALAPIDGHHELVEAAATGPLRAPALHVRGALSDIRKRCWDRLSNNLDRHADTLFENDLTSALNALYQRPLQEAASQTLARTLKEGNTENLAQLIVQLHDDDRLCVEEQEMAEDDLRIVCSLGLKS